MNHTPRSPDHSLHLAETPATGSPGRGGAVVPTEVSRPGQPAARAELEECRRASGQPPACELFGAVV